MMKIFYDTGIILYSFVIKFASLFNKKAKLRAKGVKETFKKLSGFKSQKTIWFHCASLGEFEQGRPLIEKIKKITPDYKTAVSFFSPSGYEIRKKYEFADIVFYFPDDTTGNAKKLLKLLNPDFVFFIKYEFWHNTLKTIYDNNIPVFLVSGIFRKNQIFFKPYGKFFRKTLNFYSRLFVQNTESEKLLNKAGIKNVTVAGDTRFDRVFEISKNKKRFEKVEIFKAGKLTLIAGSTWKPDEDIILKFAEKTKNDIKIIIAPHQISDENIKRIINTSSKKTVKYSDNNLENFKNADILITDNVGMLSSLYSYGDIAYIGGGFGAGIHNTLEAAVFGIPVIFGPEYRKFNEAVELIKRNAGFSVSGFKDFYDKMQILVNDGKYREAAGRNAGNFVKENIGATDKILEKTIFKNI